MDKHIIQISIDIDEGFDTEEIAKILEDNGIVVYGIAWKATWTHDGYMKGKAPISSD
jgi:hypothetical protein